MTAWAKQGGSVGCWASRLGARISITDLAPRESSVRVVSRVAQTAEPVEDDTLSSPPPRSAGTIASSPPTPGLVRSLAFAIAGWVN